MAVHEEEEEAVPAKGTSKEKKKDERMIKKS